MEPLQSVLDDEHLKLSYPQVLPDGLLEVGKRVEPLPIRDQSVRRVRTWQWASVGCSQSPGARK